MNLDLYIDTARRVLVAGPQNSSIVQAPTFEQGNTVTMRIRALQPTANFPAGDPPYTLIPVAGRTLQLAIGTKVGNSQLHYVEQYVWTAGTDLIDAYWYADVAFNTDAVATAIGSSVSKTAYLEINLVEGTPRTILSQQVTIEASVIKNDLVTVPAGLTPLSAEAARALFVAQGPWVSPDGTKRANVYLGNDGAIHADPIS